MSDLVLYLMMAAVGYVAGGRLRERESLLKWTARLQTVAMILLIFTMGMRMGANPEVIRNLNSIGVSALVMTISVIFFSVISMTVVRKLMGIDRRGILHKAEQHQGMCLNHAEPLHETNEAAEQKAGHSDGQMNSMTLIILICVAGGLAFGHFCVPALTGDMDAFGNLAGLLIHLGLCVLLFFVGFDMGVDGTVVQHFRQVGVRVLAFPAAIMIGTLVGAGVCCLFLPLSLRETLAIGGGFGWYSLAPGIIMEAGLVTASAVSFMHNVMREFISVLIIPLVAQKAGYLETLAVPACSSMDVCLPIIERSTRSDIAVYSFISGVIESAAVPIVVPLILNLL